MITQKQIYRTLMGNERRQNANVETSYESTTTYWIVKLVSKLMLGRQTVGR